MRETRRAPPPADRVTRPPDLDAGRPTGLERPAPATRLLPPVVDTADTAPKSREETPPPTVGPASSVSRGVSPSDPFCCPFLFRGGGGQDLRLSRTRTPFRHPLPDIKPDAEVPVEGPRPRRPLLVVGHARPQATPPRDRPPWVGRVARPPPGRP